MFSYFWLSSPQNPKIQTRSNWESQPSITKISTAQSSTLLPSWSKWKSTLLKILFQLTFRPSPVESSKVLNQPRKHRPRLRHPPERRHPSTELLNQAKMSPIRKSRKKSSVRRTPTSPSLASFTPKMALKMVKFSPTPWNYLSAANFACKARHVTNPSRRASLLMSSPGNQSKRKIETKFSSIVLRLIIFGSTMRPWRSIKLNCPLSLNTSSAIRRAQSPRKVRTSERMVSNPSALAPRFLRRSFTPPISMRRVFSLHIYIDLHVWSRIIHFSLVIRPHQLLKEV